MEDGMGWLGYPSNNGHHSNEDLDAFLPPFACGGPLPSPLPPTNQPFASFLPLQLQPQAQQLPAHAVGWQQLAPYLSLPTDPATVVTSDPGQGIAASHLLQPEDLLDSSAESANMDLLLQDPNPYQTYQQSWFPNTPLWSPRPDLAPLQPLSQIIQAPVPSVQPPANNPPLPGNTTVPTCSRPGGARSSRSRRRRRPDIFRTVRQVIDGDTLLPDYWAWRKYGQKVLKSSGNMRSYYKCTTDKSCKARKYVEHCSINPVFNKIIYINTHCHPLPLLPSARVVIQAVAPAPAPAQAAPPSAMASPLLTTPPPFPGEIPVVEGPPQAPAPALPAFAPAKLSRSLSFTGVELDVEDYRDRIASGMELKENHMTSDFEDGVEEEEEEEEENNNNFMFPMPYETTASSSSGSGDDGSSTTTAPVSASIETIFDDMFGDWPWDSFCG